MSLLTWLEEQYTKILDSYNDFWDQCIVVPDNDGNMGYVLYVKDYDVDESEDDQSVSKYK